MSAANPKSPTPTRDERTLAMFFWIIDVGLHVIGPWILWRVTHRGSAYLEHHAKTAANHTLTVLALLLCFFVVFGVTGWVCLSFDQDLAAIVVLLVPLAALVGLGVFWLIVHIIGARKAHAGEWWTPPLCWRWVK